MRNYEIISLLLLIFCPFLLEKQSYCMEETKMPTATIVDAATGEAIEGAVAIAVWREHSIKEAAWFEGGKMVPVKIEEVISDKKGNIYINDFWDWHLFENKYPRLTIYKFGYVCWDQKQLFTAVEGSSVRTDFNKDNRIVQMEKWPKDFSFVAHERFINYCTGHGDLHEAPKKLFRNAIGEEDKYVIKERKHGMLKDSN